ncbi:KIF-binding protein [Megalopta genalis]|uniref:KIF-binding protein n=1 Tax=Megalopta genalis TaxID=115081 RepID=UPI003FD3FC72
MGENVEIDKLMDNLRELLDEYKELVENNKKDEGIEIMKTVEKVVINMEELCTDEEKKKELIVLHATVNLNVASLYRDIGELKDHETHLLKCLDLLQKQKIDMKMKLSPIIGCLGRLGMIYSEWNQNEKALNYFNTLDQIFVDYASVGDNYIFEEPIFTFMNIINNVEKFKTTLEDFHMLALYSMVQIYFALGDHKNSALSCHRTLCKQLYLNKTTQKLDYIDWVLNAATLSQYFLQIEAFDLARHHLAAASYILETYENILKEKTKENPESEQNAADWEDFKHRSADVAMCWSKYGIILLDVSKERLLEMSKLDEDNNETFQQMNLKKISELKSIANLKFHDLEEKIEPIENQVTDQYLLDFDDAKPIFLNVKKWLDQAKSYYTLNEHASVHVTIAKSLAGAYYHLAFFEEDGDRQAKMHKRRIDVLESVINELNPQYYKAECRQFWISLGEAYSDLLSTKLDRLNSTDRKPEAIAKINRLAQNSINNYQRFLDSLDYCFDDPELRELPDDVLQPTLSSHFHIGRLYGKMITSDKVVQADNTEKSINVLKFVVTYCTKYTAASEIMKSELYLCKELIALLPVRLNKLRESVMK